MFSVQNQKDPPSLEPPRLGLCEVGSIVNGSTPSVTFKKFSHPAAGEILSSPDPTLVV